MDLLHGHLAVPAPAGVPVWEDDPYDEAVLTDPLPLFRRLHGVPFAYLERYAMLICGRYDVVHEVFSDHERFVSSRGVGVSDFALEPPWRPPSIVLEVDPPAHDRTRRVLMRALSPKVVRDLRADFAADAEALVADLLAQGQIDGVADLAEAFPCRVFPRAVGIEDAETRKLVDYGAMVFNALGPDNALRQRIMARGPEIVPWINAACTRARLAPGGIGAAIHADETITEAEAEMLVRSLLSAGVDTTVTALGSALWCLGQNPKAFAALRADPDGMALPAFEETLRLTSPVQAFCRTAAGDCTVAGVEIAAGTKVLCVLGAANVDPGQWGADAEAYDITRVAAGHLALGVGVHACVGQNIARAEGQAVLRALGRQVSRIELLEGAASRPNHAIRALDRLPLRLRP